MNASSPFVQNINVLGMSYFMKVRFVMTMDESSMTRNEGDSGEYEKSSLLVVHRIEG